MAHALHFMMCFFPRTGKIFICIMCWTEARSGLRQEDELVPSPGLGVRKEIDAYFNRSMQIHAPPLPTPRGCASVVPPCCSIHKKKMELI